MSWFLGFAQLIHLNKGVKLLYTSCACVSVCVHVANNGFIHRCTHQACTQKWLTLYSHANWGEMVEGELPGSNGGHRDKVKNNACLLCPPVELMWLQARGEVAATCCQWWWSSFYWNQSSAGAVSLSQLKNPCSTVNLSPRCRAPHKATICPNAMCVFNSISIHSEFVVIFHLIPLACLASCCFAFR